MEYTLRSRLGLTFPEVRFENKASESNFRKGLTLI